MIFNKKIKSTSSSRTEALLQLVQSHVVNQSIASDRLAKAGLATESISDSDMHELTTATGQLQSAFESIATQINNNGAFAKLSTDGASKDAAVCAAVLAGNPRATFSQQLSADSMVATESFRPVSIRHGDTNEKRAVAFEAYDEKDNRNVVAYSFSYNLQAARQNEFGEALFPTITVSPDQLGLQVQIRLFQVMEDKKRDISGSITQFNKRNLIRAQIEPDLLKIDSTKMIPVVRPQSLADFVAATDIAPAPALLDGESIMTAPLKMGRKFDLLGLSQTDTLLEAGIMDSSDAIDPSVTLSAIYMKVGDDKIRFSTENLPTSVFAPAAQGLHRLMNLNFTTSSLLINASTKNAAGAALVTLAPIVDGEYIVRLECTVNGSINLELGDTLVTQGLIQVGQVQDSTTGNLLPLDAGVGKDIADLFANATVFGYDLRAYRTNSNRRQRGTLLDISSYTQLYSVFLRGPISVLHPVTQDTSSEATDLDGLVTATHVATSNAAVDALLSADQTLSEFVDSRDTAGVGPDTMGIGRFLVRPAYSTDSLDVATDIDSLTAADRINDLTALLTNKIRDMVYKLWIQSGYGPASEAYYGPGSKTPTVIIATDPYISRYLTITGDIRLSGHEFEVKVVSSFNQKMTGKLFVAFGQFDADTNNKPCPLHLGNMAWKPELTVVLPITRNGQISKELTVQPSFLHFVNCPILGSITVTNIDAVVANKVAINNHPV